MFEFPPEKLFGRHGVPRRSATTGDFEQNSPAPDLQSAPANLPRSVRVDSQPPPAPRPGNTPTTIGVPLKSIISRLPADLMQRVRQVDIGEAEIFVPTQKIISQIATGSVRMSFGELRQLAPPGDLHGGKRPATGRSSSCHCRRFSPGLIPACSCAAPRKSTLRFRRKWSARLAARPRSSFPQIP